MPRPPAQAQAKTAAPERALVSPRPPPPPPTPGQRQARDIRSVTRRSACLTRASRCCSAPTSACPGSPAARRRSPRGNAPWAVPTTWSSPTTTVRRILRALRLVRTGQAATRGRNRDELGGRGTGSGRRVGRDVHHGDDELPAGGGRAAVWRDRAVLVRHRHQQRLQLARRPDGGLLAGLAEASPQPVLRRPRSVTRHTGASEGRARTSGAPPYGGGSAIGAESPPCPFCDSAPSAEASRQAEDFWWDVRKIRVTRTFLTSGQKLTC